MTPTTDPRCECGGVEAHDVHLSGCPAHEGTTPATPRPWTSRINETGQMVYVEGPDGVVICSFSEAFGTANAALIVQSVNAYDQLRASEADSKALIERMQGELIAIREQRITLREENARLTQARDIRTAHFEEVARLRAEHAEMRAVVEKVAWMYEQEAHNLPDEGYGPDNRTWQYIPHALGQQARALLAKVEAK